METNENIKIKENKVDMQATQRVEYIGELLKAAQKLEETNNTEDCSVVETIENSEIVKEEGTLKEKEQNVICVDEIPTTEQTEVAEQVSEEVIAPVSGVPQDNDKKIIESKTQNITSEIKKETDCNKKRTQDKRDYRLEKTLFERINAMQGKIKESLELIKKFERINAKEENLPNIVTTLRDKLTQEVIKQFRTVGIEFNMQSFLVQSVVSDLLEIFGEGFTEFKECSENLDFVKEVQDDFESKVDLAPTSRVKNIFARIRGLFKPERRQEEIEQLERERQEKKLEEANIHLIKYKFKNNQLKNYTIRKDIVSSLTREIMYAKNSGLTFTLKEFIEEKITPEMKKLGLQYLQDNLNNAMYEEFKTKFEDISQEEFMDMHVGDIKKAMKTGTFGIAYEKIKKVATVGVVQEDSV